MESPPLIITLKLDPEAELFFNEKRKNYFPAHINYLESHLTLFHKLPSDLLLINELLEKFSRSTATLHLQVSKVKNIGNGTVYKVVSPELQSLHQQMQQAFDPYLISQDRKVLWPHITVQNKVTAYKAKLTTEKLAANFSPFEIKAIGFSSWLYLKGPWEHRKDFLFE